MRAQTQSINAQSSEKVPRCSSLAFGSVIPILANSSVNWIMSMHMVFVIKSSPWERFRLPPGSQASSVVASLLIKILFAFTHVWKGFCGYYLTTAPQLAPWTFINQNAKNTQTHTHTNLLEITLYSMAVGHMQSVGLLPLHLKLQKLKFSEQVVTMWDGRTGTAGLRSASWSQWEQSGNPSSSCCLWPFLTEHSTHSVLSQTSWTWGAGRRSHPGPRHSPTPSRRDSRMCTELPNTHHSAYTCQIAWDPYLWTCLTGNMQKPGIL